MRISSSEPSQLASRVRSGLEETRHYGALAVSLPDGDLVASAGEIDRPFFLRSSAKPFQAYVSQEAGAGLTPLELAVASASHRGLPVHITLVASMLETAGLDESALQCPPDWPLRESSTRLLQLGGASNPRRIWHNCSGKHAGFLRACSARGWPLATYLSPDHPLQMRVIEFVSELGRHRVEPVGVDGCGAPVLRTTVRTMSRLFARLASEQALRDVFGSMHRYPALVGCNDEGDTTIATTINAAAKAGAQGCIGVAIENRLGIAAKSWDGLGEIATVGAVAALDELGELTATARGALHEVSHPDVLGGGSRVGSTLPRLELELA